MGITVQAQLTTDLVAYYSFDLGTAANMTSNGAVLDGIVGSNVTPSPGKLGAGFSFPGNDQASGRIRVPDNALLDLTTGVTLSAWVNTTSSNRQMIVTKTASGNNTYFMEQLNGRVNGGVNTNPTSSGNITERSGSVTINNGLWNHVAVTYDGASLLIYVNGVQNGSRSVSGNLFNNNTSLYIGDWQSSGRSFTGMIDEVGVWGRALSQAEIGQLYNNGLGFNPFGTTVPTISQWGLIILALLILNLGAIALFRRREVLATA